MEVLISLLYLNNDEIKAVMCICCKIIIITILFFCSSVSVLNGNNGELPQEQVLSIFHTDKVTMKCTFTDSNNTAIIIIIYKLYYN